MDTGERFMCSERQHLLQGMRALGKRGIPSGCHGGGCGVCKLQVVGGKTGYETLPMSREHVTEEEEARGIALACRVFPRRDIEINVLGKIRKNVLRPSGGYVFGQPIKTKHC